MSTSVVVGSIFLSNGVMSTSVVVGSIFLSGDELFRVEELAVGSSSDFINDSGFQINKDCSGYVFAGSSFSKESSEGVITSHHFIGWHLTVRLDAMFQAVEFPAGVSNLAASLANMY